MANAIATLRQTVAEFYEVDEGQVGPGFSLNTGRGSTSIARAALDAAIRRRVGAKSDRVYSARTFGELVGETDDQVVATPASAAEPAPHAAPTGLACGVDLEDVASLPTVVDCWDDPFYRDRFSPAEIAYCLLQANPAPHFAARWAAKEALAKCDPGFLGLPSSRVEVAHEPSGAPFLNDLRGGSPRRLPHVVSLSHTATSAVAVVVLGPSSPAPVVAAASVPVPAAPAPVAVPRGEGKLAVLTLLAALGALAVAAWSLLRTFPGATP